MQSQVPKARSVAHGIVNDSGYDTFKAYALAQAYKWGTDEAGKTANGMKLGVAKLFELMEELSDNYESGDEPRKEGKTGKEKKPDPAPLQRKPYVDPDLAT